MKKQLALSLLGIMLLGALSAVSQAAYYSDGPQYWGDRGHHHDRGWRHNGYDDRWRHHRHGW